MVLSSLLQLKLEYDDNITTICFWIPPPPAQGANVDNRFTMVIYCQSIVLMSLSVTKQ